MLRSTKKSNNRPSHKPRRNPWLTALIVTAWCIGVLVVLAAIAVWIIAYQIKPSKIISIIEKESQEYLNAEVKIGRLDYKIRGSYPWFEFEIDSLALISNSLAPASPQLKNSLPPYADSLFMVEKVKGQINIHDLLRKKINLRGIEISRPSVNIVVAGDSLANFYILKKTPSGDMKMPEVQVGDVRILGPTAITFLSIPQDAQASLTVDDFSLGRIGDNDYLINFIGEVDGRYQDFSLPGKVPIKFNTSLNVDQKNLDIVLKDFSLTLAGLSFIANGDIKAGKDGINLKEAGFSIKIDDLFTLLNYLPSQLLQLIPIPEGLSGCLPINLSVSLDQPWFISSQTLDKFAQLSHNPQDLIPLLPAMLANVSIDDATLYFSPPKGKRVEADDIYLNLLCNFSPDSLSNTYLSIHNFHLNGEGIALSGSALVEGLLDSVQNISGKVNFASSLMESLSYLVPNSGVKIIGALKGEADFNATALNLGKDGLKDLKIKGGLHSKNLKVNSSNIGNIRVNNFSGKYDGAIPSYPLKDYSGTRLEFELKADSIGAHASGINLLLGNLDIRLDALDSISGAPDPAGTLSLTLGKMEVSQGGNKFSGKNLTASVNGTLNSSGQTPSANPVAATTAGDDALIASRVAHTPLVVEYEGGGILQTIMTLMNLDASLSMRSGEFKSPAYLYPVTFSDFSLGTNLNHWSLSASKIAAGRTSFKASCMADGILPFLTSYEATPLKATAQIEFDNVDINQLSRGYYGALLASGVPYDSVFYVAPIYPMTAADSLCVAIPRNIDARIALKAKSAEYMDFTFSPLSTDIIVKNGAATLSKLTVGAPYCTAIVDWTYSTSSLDNIFMSLDAEVKDFSFPNFYKTFPSLIEKSPEIHNFTGALNLFANCHFQMFPDMFMNEASLQGKFDLKAYDMEFARTGKIERITHLMLIEGDEPIKIQNMNITGGFHDNILLLNPFQIKFDDYQLEVGGVNNTSGDIFYHLALEKSPFHLPFGVTLEGKFKHPEIKLGGTHVKDYTKEMVLPSPDKKLDVNIMAWLHHGWLLFVQEAAKYGE